MVLAVLPATAFVQTSAALNQCTVPDASIDGEERALIATINDYRASHGLVRLTVADGLEQTATWMTNDMTTKSGFSHTDSLGRSFWKRAQDCGYPLPGGENIGAGTERATASAAFQLFKNSPEHDAIMLSPEFREIGVARAQGPRYGWYWAVEFGLGAGDAAVAPAAQRPALPILHLTAGANLVVWPAGDADPAVALAGANVDAVYAFDPANGSWTQFSPLLPPYTQTLSQLHQGFAYWVIAKSEGNIGG